MLADVVELPVRRKRRHRALFASGALQDGPVALTLLAAGAAGLRAPRSAGHLALALVELAVAAVVLRFLVRGGAEAFARGGTEPFAVDPMTGAPVPPQLARPRVRWEGVAAGLLALVEVWHRWHLTAHLHRPTLVVAVATLALALGGAAAIERRTAHRRERLVVTREGVRYRGGPRRRDQFAARWEQVARVEQASGALRLVLRDGRAWALHAHEHLDGRALVAAAGAAVAAHAPARLLAGGAGRDARGE